MRAHVLTLFQAVGVLVLGAAGGGCALSHQLGGAGDAVDEIYELNNVLEFKPEG